eukprot:7242361-Pyramimonas_sp.AAC.1
MIFRVSHTFARRSSPHVTTQQPSGEMAQSHSVGWWLSCSPSATSLWLGSMSLEPCSCPGNTSAPAPGGKPSSVSQKYSELGVSVATGLCFSYSFVRSQTCAQHLHAKRARRDSSISNRN